MQQSPPSPSRAALRRLIIVVSFAVGLVIFAYGWSVTQINLDRPQEPLRQQNVGNALRELLSPNVLVQDYEIQNSMTPILMQCPAEGEPPEAATAPEGDGPYVIVTPTCASSGDVVTVQGFNFYPDSLARVNWIATDGERRIRQVDGLGRDNFVTEDDGTFSVSIEVPRIRGTAGETHNVEVQGRFPIGAPHLSDTTGLVLEKMVETIFLALIATALSILPSAILSVFAAHNLMRPITMTLGNLLVMVALLPVGWFLGTTLLVELGKLALNIGSGGEAAALGTASMIFVIGAVGSRRLPTASEHGLNDRLRAVGNAILIAAAVIVVIGLVGGLGILFGGLFRTGIPGYLSNMIGDLGELLALLMTPIAGIVGAFTLSSIGTTLTINRLKTISAPITNVLGGALGAVSGAFVLAVSAQIGTQAAWLGLLTPIIAASLGGQVLPMVYDRFFKPAFKSNRSPFARNLLFWVGGLITFGLTFTYLNVGRALIEGTLPSSAAVTSIIGFPISAYMLKGILIGAVLGAVTGALAGTKATFPIGEVLYTTTRTILNGLRSIEPLIMGLVFVIWVGIGPFAGVLALTLHSIASLGKLYSEQVESIDTGPIEALQSTGANRLQTIMYAVVPQIIPPYIAFTMYRWDINVRMSTIIGFVGGGGIGFLLQQQINLLRYRDAGVAVLAIAIVVSILDYLSASIRERYV